MKILIAGDSMVKYLYQDLPVKANGFDIDILAYPGYNIKHLTWELKNATEYNAIFLHVGTNDTKKTPEAITTDYLDLIHEVKKRNNAVIFISEILPRKKNNFQPFKKQDYEFLNRTADKVNYQLRALSRDSRDVKFISAAINWNNYLSYDGVHLSREGNKQLAKFFFNEIRNFTSMRRQNEVKETVKDTTRKNICDGQKKMNTYAAVLANGLLRPKSPVIETKDLTLPSATPETNTLTHCDSLKAEVQSIKSLNLYQKWTVVKSRKKKRTPIIVSKSPSFESKLSQNLVPIENDSVGFNEDPSDVDTGEQTYAAILTKRTLSSASDSEIFKGKRTKPDIDHDNWPELKSSDSKKLLSSVTKDTAIGFSENKSHISSDYKSPFFLFKSFDSKKLLSSVTKDTAIGFSENKSHVSSHCKNIKRLSAPAESLQLGSIETVYLEKSETANEVNNSIELKKGLLREPSTTFPASDVNENSRLNNFNIKKKIIANREIFVYEQTYLKVQLENKVHWNQLYFSYLLLLLGIDLLPLLSARFSPQMFVYEQRYPKVQLKNKVHWIQLYFLPHFISDKVNF